MRRRQRILPGILDIGLVGKVKEINADLIPSLGRDGFIPVIAPTGAGDSGETYNINADIVAGAIAAALKAEKLILLTDVAGVLNKQGELINTMNNMEALEMIHEGVIEAACSPR